MADIQPGVNYDAVNALYNRHLGRSASQDEYSNWANGTYGASDLAGIGSQIQSSGEAQAYRQANPTSQAPTVARTTQQPTFNMPGIPTPGYATAGPNVGQQVGTFTATPTPASQQYGGQAIPTTSAAPTDLMSRIQGALAGARSTDDPNYWYGKISADPNGQGSAWNYWQDRINRGNGAQLGLPLFNDAPQGGGAAGGGGQGYSGTSVFNDPATQQYESLINSLIGRLNTPYQAPHYQQSIDQLNTYLGQLNGPAYTPQQQDILQTQALDPIERQRQQQKQQAMTRLGTRGIGPTSGITESALQGVDNSFNTIDAQTRAGLATNQIGVQRQNAAQAAQLAPQIAALEAGQYGQQTNNMLQGVNLASIIPQTAWSRLTGANSLIQPLNPATLLNQQQSYQQQGYGQSSDYMNYVMQILGGLFR